METFIDAASLEDWYPGQPAEVLRRCTVIERYAWDGRPRLKVRIEEGAETGRIVSGFSPGPYFLAGLSLLNGRVFR